MRGKQDEEEEGRWRPSRSLVRDRGLKPESCTNANRSRAPYVMTLRAEDRLRPWFTKFSRLDAKFPRCKLEGMYSTQTVQHVIEDVCSPCAMCGSRRGSGGFEFRSD